MTPMTVFLLVFVAAFLHAWWNFLAKTIPSGAPFVWLSAVCSTVLLLPVIIWYSMVYGFEVDARGWFFLAVTAVVHLVYFLWLQRGYLAADLSVVYPLARGTGPVFSTLGAVIFLNEKLSWTAVGGLCLVVVGVALVAGLTNASWRTARTRDGIFYGLTTGLLIAAYTVWDGYSVKILWLSPLLVEFFSHPVRVAVLGGVARKRWPEVVQVWRVHRRNVLIISTAGPLGFMLVLFAMQVAPIHFVAPARELSIVIGVLLGGRLLTEAHFKTRLAGAVLIVAGIVGIAI